MQKRMWEVIISFIKIYGGMPEVPSLYRHGKLSNESLKISRVIWLTLISASFTLCHTILPQIAQCSPISKALLPVPNIHLSINAQWSISW